MAKLEAEDSADPSLSPVEEKKLEDSMFKAAPKNLASLAAEDSGPSSETSSIAPDDEATLFNSEADIKRKSPRKLIEDEKRSTGRIAWPIWKTYMTVSIPSSVLLTSSLLADRSGVGSVTTSPESI